MAESVNTTRNEDWTRTQTWDLHDARGQISTLASLLKNVLYVDRAPVAVQRKELRRFMALPAAEAMPADLRAEVDAFLTPNP